MYDVYVAILEPIWSHLGWSTTNIKFCESESGFQRDRIRPITTRLTKAPCQSAAGHRAAARGGDSRLSSAGCINIAVGGLLHCCCKSEDAETASPPIAHIFDPPPLLLFTSTPVSLATLARLPLRAIKAAAAVAASCKATCCSHDKRRALCLPFRERLSVRALPVMYHVCILCRGREESFWFGETRTNCEGVEVEQVPFKKSSLWL